MASISLTITESPLQKVAGIPQTVTIEANVPATIFYTLDGTIPDTTSRVAIGPITLPTNENTVVLQAFATDGTLTSAFIYEVYGSSTSGNRNPHDKVSGLEYGCNKATFPFGSAVNAAGVN